MTSLPLLRSICHSLSLLLLYNALVSWAEYLPDQGKDLGHAHQQHLIIARLTLYRDTSYDSYYATNLYIGTPPQKFTVVVDTGSNMTFVPCRHAGTCGTHENPSFRQELSSSYKAVNCTERCKCDMWRSNCTYETHYGEWSSSSGELAVDIVSFGKETEFAPQSLVFGCGHIAVGKLYSQIADGILGLGRGISTIVDQLVEKGVIDDSFSLCFGGMHEGGGHMILGSFYPPPSDMVFTNLNTARSAHYNVELTEIQIAGKPLDLDPTIFDSGHRTILDSGTTYAFFPENAFSAFRNAILTATSFLKLIKGRNSVFNDTCFAVTAWEPISSLEEIFPKVEMVFSNHKKLSLAPENYLFPHPSETGAYCLGIYPSASDMTTYLGGIIVRNTLVTYDRQNNRIGFWKTNCSDLRKGLNISTLGQLSTTGFTPGEHQANSDMEIPDEPFSTFNQQMHEEL